VIIDSVNFYPCRRQLRGRAFTSVCLCLVFPHDI